jgi:hypothetical protein
VNRDRANEFVVGAPDAPVKGKANAVKVVVFRGRADGPSTGDIYSFTAASPGVVGSPATNAFFGSVLALRDLTGDNRAELVIGVPFASVKGFTRAGAIEVLRSVGGTLTGAGSKQFTEATSGVPGTVRKGDLFGDALYGFSPTPKGAPELVVGAPGAQGGSTPVRHRHGVPYQQIRPEGGRHQAAPRRDRCSRRKVRLRHPLAVHAEPVKKASNRLQAPFSTGSANVE